MKKILFTIVMGAALLGGCTSTSGSGDAEMDKFINNLMSKMSVDDKIGQLNLHSYGGFRSAEKVNEDDENVKQLIAGQMGGMYGISNVNTLRELQDIALNKTKLGIPLFFGLDIIHGHETVFPIPLAMSMRTLVSTR